MPGAERADAARKDKLFSLLTRYAQLGSLLPTVMDDLDLSDAAAVADFELVLAEMDQTKAKIEALCVD